MRLKKYKYDVICLTILTVIILIILKPIYGSGQIVFSDIDFGFSSKGYLNEIFGVWNERWSSPTLLNIPRLIYILPFYFLSMLFNYSGAVFLKGFLTVIILSAGYSMYFFTKRFMSVYYVEKFDFVKSYALIIAALLYAINPWVITRIQHVYLLCGYGLFPLMFLAFFNAFDPNFQEKLIKNYNINSLEIHKRNIYDLFMLTVIFAFSASAIHYFFYGVIFLSILLFLIFLKLFIAYLMKKKYNYKNIIKNLIFKSIIFIILFMLTNAYWLFMYVFSILLKAQVTQHNINVIDTYFMFGRYSSIKNILYLISYWWPMFDIKTIPVSFYISGGVILAIIFYTVVFKTYKNNILLFFTMSSLVCLVLATGTNIDMFKKLFLTMTNLPIIGSIFRDPNKLVALMLMGFCVLLSVGIQNIILKFENKTYAKPARLIIPTTLLVCLIIYINPYYSHFIKGFYSPVKEPKEYIELQNQFSNKKLYTSKVLYLPLSDEMTQANTGIATPYWNVNGEKAGMAKATGDVHIYTTQKNSIFQYEGNTVNLQYYMGFLQYLMDYGMTHNLDKLIGTFGVNEFVYRKEYLGQEIRQSFNKSILALQDGLKKKYENAITTLYEVKNTIGYLYNVPKKVYTPYGFSRLESYINMPNFNFNDYGVIFSSIDKMKYIQSLNKGDYIETSSLDDILLSNINQDDYVLPFDSIDSINPFLNWSKNLVQNSDWMNFLKAYGIDNYPFDFDYNSGIAFTVASSKVNLPANKIQTAKGKAVADMKSLIKSGKFFVADDPKSFTIEAKPENKANEATLVHGEIEKGESGNIWQEAKLGVLKAKENNPYRFSIIASGENVNKMHFKAKFYDKDMKELESVYVVKPSDNENFQLMNFEGEYVSPPDTKYMQLELLSYKNPKAKTKWWIHDINIDDLGQYKTNNTFSMNKKLKKAEEEKVYMRTFISSKGGMLKVKIGDKVMKINTLNKSINQFQWINLGSFKFKGGDNKISVESAGGFNAVNVFAVVPEGEYKSLVKTVSKTANKTNIFCVMEAENDFEYTGNIQSQRVVPKFSLGRGISSQNGTLEKDIDILKTCNYSFALNMNAYNKNNGDIELKIENLSNNEVITRIVSSSDFTENKEKLTDCVDKDGSSDAFPQVLKKLPDEMNYYKEEIVKNIYLEKGKYRLKIIFNSKVPSLSNLGDMHKFKSDEVKVSKENMPEEGKKNENSVSITDDMMNSHLEKDGLLMNFQKTSSQNWYDYASNKIPVKEQKEYLFQADIISKNVKDRHMKILFLDESYNIVSSKYINEVDERFKGELNSYSQIIMAPKGAKYMQLHILCRGNESEDGYIKIRNYSILDYSQLICLDNVIMYEGNDYNSFFQKNLPKKTVKYSKVDSMKRKFNINNPKKENVLINYIESPTPLWQISINGKKERDNLSLNGITSGFTINGDGNGEITIILRKIYYCGFALVFVSIIVFIIVYKKVNLINYFIRKKHKGKSKKANKNKLHFW